MMKIVFNARSRGAVRRVAGKRKAQPRVGKDTRIFIQSPFSHMCFIWRGSDVIFATNTNAIRRCRNNDRPASDKRCLQQAEQLRGIWQMLMTSQRK